MQYARITNLEQLKRILANKQPFIIYKDSDSCSICQYRKKEISETVANNNQVVYILEVKGKTRHLSNYLAEIANIKHQSPQVLVFNQKPKAMPLLPMNKAHSIHLKNKPVLK